MLNDEADILRAFEDRAYALSEAGGYEREYDARQADAMAAKGAEAAEKYVASLGLGDMIPSPAEYDYGAMLADGFHPKPDGAGRLPLPPQYWKPGQLVVRGVDLATGQRVGSAVSLEDMVVDGLQDEGEALMSEPLKAEDMAELSIPERNSLEAWLQTRGMQVVAGPAQKIAAKDAKQAPKPQKTTAADVGVGMLDMLAGALKGGVAQTLGLPGDVESLIRMLADKGDGQVLPTTEGVSNALPAVVPDGDPARAASVEAGQTVGEFVGLGGAAKAASQAMKTAAPAAAAVGTVAADTKSAP